MEIDRNRCLRKLNFGKFISKTNEVDKNIIWNKLWEVVDSVSGAKL